MNKLLFLFLLLPLFSFASRKDTLVYQIDQSLHWGDFKGKAPKGAKNTALTASGISIQASLNEQDEFNVTVTPFFYTKESWVKKDNRNDYLLNHEQRHFDITAIYAYKLQQKINNTKITRKNFNTILNQLNSEIEIDKNKMQRQYDQETQHSINKEAQARWDKKIDLLLKAIKQ